ncbi:MAG: ComEC/Rec2 family competence protein [Robiginitalea sp.]
MHSHTPASLFLAASLTAGIATASLLRPDILPCLLLLVSGICLLGLSKNWISRHVFWSLAGLISFALGMWSMARTLPENRPLHYAHHKTGQAGPAQVRILEELRHNAFSYRYLGEVTGLEGRPAEGMVLLEIRRDSAAIPLKVGQEVLSTNAPAPLTGPGNPGQFDYRAYLHDLGVYGRLTLKDPTVLPIPAGKSGFMSSVSKIRTHLLTSLENVGLDPAGLGIAKALLLGDRTRVAPELYTSYRKAGALHLLAVSGLHVGILAALVYGLLGPLRNFRYGRQLRLLLGTALLWGYALLCGYSPSVVRAVILFSFVSYAFYLQRPGETLHFLAMAWIFMLVLINPNWLLQVGFQLSFAAVGAIVVFTPVLLRRWPWKGTPGNYLGRLVCVSLAAQAGTLPLTLFYFHQFPGVFLLTNLVLLPWIGILLIMGFACLCLQVLSLLPPLLAICYGQLLSLMNGFIQWAGSLDGFHLQGIPWDVSQLVLSAGALVLLGAYLRYKNIRLLWATAMFLLGFQLRTFSTRMDHLNTNTWIVPNKVRAGGFWTRQGNQLQVFSGDPTRMHSLIRDAGTVWYLDSIQYHPLFAKYDLGSHTLRVLDSSAMYSPAESSPDFLLLTGSPRIHLGRLLEELQPGQVIADGNNYKSLVKRWEKSCEKRGIPFHNTSADGAFIQEILP